MPRPLLLSIVCGDPPASVASLHGNDLDWFAAVFEGRVSLDAWRIQDTCAQPDLSRYAGILITGSPATLLQPKPWMEVAVETIRQASETQLPVLGVCFGHQLIGAAFGAPASVAANGGELGSLEITLSQFGAADPLFKGCPPSFPAQLTHRDQIDPEAVAYSNGLRILASSATTAVQALAGGDYVRSVQFHPEFSTAIMRSYALADAKGSGSDAPLADTPFARQVLHNWLDGWIFSQPLDKVGTR